MNLVSSLARLFSRKLPLVTNELVTNIKSFALDRKVAVADAQHFADSVYNPQLLVPQYQFTDGPVGQPGSSGTIWYNGGGGGGGGGNNNAVTGGGGGNGIVLTLPVTSKVTHLTPQQEQLLRILQQQGHAPVDE